MQVMGGIFASWLARYSIDYFVEYFVLLHLLERHSNRLEQTSRSKAGSWTEVDILKLLEYHLRHLSRVPCRTRKTSTHSPFAFRRFVMLSIFQQPFRLYLCTLPGAPEDHLRHRTVADATSVAIIPLSNTPFPTYSIAIAIAIAIAKHQIHTALSSSLPCHAGDDIDASSPSSSALRPENSHYGLEQGISRVTTVQRPQDSRLVPD